MQKSTIKDKLLLKNGEMIDPCQEKIERQDILINDGKIEKIKAEIDAQDDYKVIDLKGLKIAPGFIDLHTHLREPGQEDAETIATGARAALAGGFTRVCCMPNTNPSLSTQESMRFIREKAKLVDIDVMPIASITIDRKGRELTEFGELAEVGAVAFSDDGNPVENSQIMRNALEYSKLVDKPIINHSEDQDLKNQGIINESIVSTTTGLRGNPTIAEEIMIYRDLRLAEFTGAKLHIPHVTAKGSVDLIRAAQEKGVRVTAEVTPHHLSLTDEYMHSFNTLGKVAPPLRSESDRQALVEGLKDGTIDAIATDHAPHTYNRKETSLDLAAYGMIGLESAFGLVMTKLVHEDQLSLIELIKKMTTMPAAIIDIELPCFKTGERAEFTLFDTDEWWVFNEKNIESRSSNTPFIGQELTGRVKKVIIGNKVIEI
ncbi:MAG: dihydroorotase [Candidatus Marinimicrobia bacterium]|nr:dihydroorotase [Candidatus Neomarinimicrobiota bacterium]